MKISKKLQVIYSITISILSYLLPVALYQITDTVERSISAYHETEAQTALFIMLLILSTSLFTGLTKYKIAGGLLILVAIFNINYGWIHDVVAGIFFVYTTALIFLDNRFYILSIPMILSAIFLNNIGMYSFEVITIFCISAFSMLHGLRYLKIINVK